MFFSKIDGRILLKLDKNKRLSIKRQKIVYTESLHLDILINLEDFVDLDILLCLDVLDLQILLNFKDWFLSTLRRFCRLRHFSKLIFFVDFNILATLGMFCKMSKSTKPSKRA